MYAFNYHRPDTLAEAAELLATRTEAALLAGGMTLLPTLKLRLAQPTDLVDLGSIPELRGVSDEKDSIRIGAMTCHADVTASEDVQKRIPALATLAGRIGDAQVRNRGTIGGSVSNNDPAADYPAAVLGLGATVLTDRREIRSDEYFLGMFETALEPGEIVRAVRFPVPERAAYMKFRNPASGYAMVGVLVACTPAGVRVAVTGAGPGVFRLAQYEEALTASFSAAALNGLEVDASDFNDDLHASPAYRADLVKVLARRAVQSIEG